MDEQKQHVIDSLKQATNILVTVRKNPTIDQLSACIALTLILNEVDKHATAVFSGQVPSMLSYLKPDKTIERNTDSLQDFIISLDKAKADKLRYKVEDTVVKIFITPYRTSLSNKDLEFGQGDFNVDVVVALGVHDQADVDEAITAHGRILHDATVISITNDNEANKDLGSVSWVNTSVSGLSEMIFSIANSLGKDDAIDNQAATALLTGIVAETERFGNLKTTPATMEIAAKLLISGANQELVANAMTESSKPAPPASNNNNSGPTSSNSSSNGGNDSQNIPQDTSASGNNNSNAAMPALLDSLDSSQETKPGELEIEHHDSDTGSTGLAEPSPYTGPVSNSSFNSPQLENTPFDPPQQKDNNQPAMPAIIDLPSAQPNPSNPNNGGKPSFNQPPLNAGIDSAAALNPGGQGQGHVEDQAALDYLKGRKVENNMRGRIEPLSDQGNYLEGLPQHNDGNTKFALTPPTMGGTLTASMDADHDSAPTDAMKSQPSSAAPLLSHDKLSVSQPAPVAAATDRAEPLVASLLTEPAGISVIPPAQPLAGQTKAASPGAGHPTLDQLERQVHSNHTEGQTKSASKPPVGAMDMPKPAAPAVELPAPLIETLPVGQSTISTPPPVPPPFPSMPA